MSYPRYPEYTASEFIWMEEKPSHWQELRAKVLFQKMDRPPAEDDDIVTAFRDGTVTLRKNRRIDGFTNSVKEIGYQGIRKGDLVIHAMDAFAGAIGISDSDGKSTPVYSVCTPKREDVYPPFYARLLRHMALSGFIASLTKGIRERSTEFRYKEFSELILPLPPIPEQRAISAFLDRETARIDTLITKQEQMITLLQEKRKAIISHAVTRGLDPNVPLKDSGVDWLGMVPEHWKIKRLAKVAYLHRGYDLPADTRKEGTVPVITSGGSVDFHNEAKAVGPGVVMGRYGTTGELFYVEDDYWPHNTALYVHNFHGNVPRYVFYMLQILPFEAHSGKSAVPGIDRNDLHVLLVSEPPVDEQQAIAAYLDRETAKIDTLIAKAQAAINLLKEHRVSLISAAVTGKIDVRAV